MVDFADLMGYDKYYAEVVEAFRISVSDVGAVPTASTISTDRRCVGYRAQLAFTFETNLLLRELFCAFDGGDIGSTGCSKGTKRPKAHVRCKRQCTNRYGTSCLSMSSEGSLETESPPQFHGLLAQQDRATAF